MKKMICMLMAAGLCGPTMAVVTSGTISGAGAFSGSSSDLLQNAVVTDSTETNTEYPFFNIDNLFTSGSPVENPDGGYWLDDVVFVDSNETTTSFVEFNVPGVSALTTIDVVLQSDGTNSVVGVDFDRALNNVKVYVGTSPETVLPNLVADIAVNPDYETVYGETRIVLTIDFPIAISGEYFRVEFEEFGPRACRVFEVDGWNNVPETPAVGSVALYLDGDSNDAFQLSTVLSNTPLHSLSTPASDIRDLFTKGSPITSDANMIFEDTEPTPFVEFRAPAQLNLTNLVVYLNYDGAPDFQRSVENIQVYAGLTQADLRFNQIANLSVDPDYATAYGGATIGITIDVPGGIDARYFRVVFQNHASGCRIMEIDGYGTQSFDVTMTVTPDPALVIGDSLDQLQFATVTTNSPLHPQTGPATDIRDLFTAASSYTSDGVMIFSDGISASRFVEFNSPAQLVLSNMVFTLVNEGVTQGRAINSIKLYAGTSPENVLGNLVAHVPVDPDYVTAYGSQKIAVDLTFPSGVTGQYFRVDLGLPPSLSGCRIFEIDGYGSLYFPGTSLSVTPMAPGDLGSSTDDFQFATVTANYPLNVASVPPNISDDIRDLFTAGTPYTSDENMFFTDGIASTWVEFNTADSLSLTNITIRLINGGVTAGRSVNRVKVYASESPGDLLGKQVAAFPIDYDYLTAYGSQTIVVDIDFATAVVGQYFRVEFGLPFISGYWGNRIFEIDGHGALFIPPLLNPEIVSFANVSGQLRMVVNGPSSSEKYTVMAKNNLVLGSWVPVAHSDDGVNPFVVTNLSYSGAEGTNEVIYLESADSAKFFRIEGN